MTFTFMYHIANLCRISQSKIHILSTVSLVYSTSSEPMRRLSLQLIHTLNAKARKHAKMVTGYS